MNSDTPLVITGMHRSGTSMAARYIRESGINLGDDLIGPDAGNAYGHFEDRDIVDFHKQILLREYNTPSFAPCPPRVTPNDRQRAIDLIATRKTKPLWGWKDPRTSLFLDFWNELLPKAFFLFLVRSPISVVDSLLRRDEDSRTNWRSNSGLLLNWMTYNRECYRFHHEHRDRCLLVILDQVVEHPDLFVKLLSERLSYPFDRALFERLFDRNALKGPREAPKFILALPHRMLSCLSQYRTMRRATDLR